MRRKIVIPLPIREVLGQSLQVVHVLGKVFRDVGFQNFENAAFTPSTDGIAPGEAHHRADAGL